jgi:hypothetical protein
MMPISTVGWISSATRGEAARARRGARAPRQAAPLDVLKLRRVMDRCMGKPPE